MTDKAKIDDKLDNAVPEMQVTQNDHFIELKKKSCVALEILLNS